MRRLNFGSSEGDCVAALLWLQSAHEELRVAGEEDHPGAVGGAHPVDGTISILADTDPPQQFRHRDELRLVDRLVPARPQRFDPLKVDLEEQEVRPGGNERRIRVVPGIVRPFHRLHNRGTGLLGRFTSSSILERFANNGLDEAHHDLPEDDRFVAVDARLFRIVGVRPRLADHCQSQFTCGRTTPGHDVHVRRLTVKRTIEDRFARRVKDHSGLDRAEAGSHIPVTFDQLTVKVHFPARVVSRSFVQTYSGRHGTPPSQSLFGTGTRVYNNTIYIKINT